MRLALIVLISSPVWAQVLSVGAKGGLPLTDAIATNASGSVPAIIIPGFPPFDTCAQCIRARAVPYVVGPAVEVHLRAAFSLDVEALYSRVDYDRSFGGIAGFGSNFSPEYFANVTATKQTIDRWEFPLLLKYKTYANHLLRPFVDGGITVQSNRGEQVEGLTGNAGVPRPGMPGSLTDLSVKQIQNSAPYNSVIAGATFGIGMSFGTRRVRPSLEFRYTRWFDKAFTVDSSMVTTPPTPMPHIAYSVMNQAQLLLGIEF